MTDLKFSELSKELQLIGLTWIRQEEGQYTLAGVTNEVSETQEHDLAANLHYLHHLILKLCLILRVVIRALTNMR